jgi:hypothetical protein
MRRGVLRTFALPFFLALAVLAAQWAGQLHDLSHLQHDLATAAFVKAGEQGRQGNKPLLNHAREQCVVFHGLDCHAASTPSLPPLAQHDALIVVLPVVPVLVAARPPFSSRAPPVFF